MKLKKLIIVGMVLVSIALLCACKGNSNSEPAIIEGEVVSDAVSENDTVENAEQEENASLEESSENADMNDAEESEENVEDLLVDLNVSTITSNESEISSSAEESKENTTKPSGGKKPTNGTETEESVDTNTLEELYEIP